MKKLLLPAMAMAIAPALMTLGCGYHTAGKASRLPQGVHTIAIPTFVNQTQTYRIEQVLTEAVLREFNSRTNYRVSNALNDSADASLRGVVVSTSLVPVTYDSRTGRASSVLVTVNLNVNLADHKGAVIFANPNYVFREQYQISLEISSFFEEESRAVERISRDFARTLVSNILEAY